MPAGQLSVLGLYALKIDLMILEKITLIMQNLPIYLHGGSRAEGQAELCSVFIPRVMELFCLPPGLSEQHHWPDSLSTSQQPDQPPDLPYQLLPWGPVSKVMPFQQK